MQWFFAYSSFATDWFDQMIRVAVTSARQNTSLEPHCLYDGPDTYLTAWLEEHGVQVHRTQVPFRDELFAEETRAKNGPGYKPDHAAGNFLRLMVSEFARDQVVLYTDCDVMFRSEPRVPSCRTIAAAPESTGTGSFNAGVMAVNTDYFSRISKPLIDFIRSRGFFVPEFSSYDQILQNEFFAGIWKCLPAEMNWRPFQGVNRAAQIVHFHGPKPPRIQAILDGKLVRGEHTLPAILQAHKAAYDFYLEEFNRFLAEPPPPYKETCHAGS